MARKWVSTIDGWRLEATQLNSFIGGRVYLSAARSRGKRTSKSERNTNPFLAAINHGGVIFYIRNEAINVPVALMKPLPSTAPQRSISAHNLLSEKKMGLRGKKNKRGCVGQKIKGAAGWEARGRGADLARAVGASGGAVCWPACVFVRAAQRKRIPGKAGSEADTTSTSKEPQRVAGVEDDLCGAPNAPALSCHTVTGEGRSRTLSHWLFNRVAAQTVTFLFIFEGKKCTCCVAKISRAFQISVLKTFLPASFRTCLFSANARLWNLPYCESEKVPGYSEQQHILLPVFL